jgi:excisionase family DNA binding protein
MDPLISIEEACVLLKMSKQALYGYVKQKKIPAFKFQRRWKFQRSALEKWIEEQMEESNKTIKQ